MPLQNRVTPWSELVAAAVRYALPAAMFGNRGCLHDVSRNIVRQCAGRMWISCILNVDRTRKIQRNDNRAFNGRKRVLMTPRRYTELFFLDEPTALAAGHRPCGCCRRKEFAKFMECWKIAMPREECWTAADVDMMLHGERYSKDGSKVLYTAPLETLPDGVIVALNLAATRKTLQDGDCWLKWAGHLHRWGHVGYVQRRENVAGTQPVRVLTPRSMVATMRAGFEPSLPHISAHVEYLHPDGQFPAAAPTSGSSPAEEAGETREGHDFPGVKRRKTKAKSHPVV